MATNAGPSSGPTVKESLRETAAAAERGGERLAQDATAAAKEVAAATKSAAAAQRSQAADYVHGVSEALKSGGRTLGDKGHGASAEVVEQAADQIDALARGIAERAPRDLLREVEDFARQRPALFLGAAVLAGLGVSRFLKSSAPHPRYHSGESGGPDHGAEAGPTYGTAGKAAP